MLELTEVVVDEFVLAYVLSELGLTQSTKLSMSSQRVVSVLSAGTRLRRKANCSWSSEQAVEAVCRLRFITDILYMAG